MMELQSLINDPCISKAHGQYSLGLFPSHRVGYSPKWWYTIIPHSHLIGILHILKSRRSRMHLWCLFPFCSLPRLPCTAPSCVLSLLSTAQKRSKREAHSRRPCCGNVQPCMPDVMMITMYMSHKCYAKAQELRITKQKSPMEQKL